MNGASRVPGGSVAKRDRIKAIVRWLVVGRREGLRAKVRSAFGLFTWLDRTRPAGTSATPEAPATPARPSAGDETPVPDGWTAVLSADELDEGDVMEVMLGERAIAVARVDGEYYALDNVCPHAGGPLGDGVLDGCSLTCPWHGYSFDVRDGGCEVDPSLHVETLPVQVKGGRVLVHALAADGPV